MWAIIAGTGFEKSDQVEALGELNRDTPFGQASSGLKKVSVGGQEVIFVPRHGLTHELLPSEINFRANIFALKRAGASRILAISAIGSLREELKPGDAVVPDQYINRTVLPRGCTFCGDGVVGHVSLAKPVCPECTTLVKQVRGDLDFDIHLGGTLVTIEGPYFSTKAESMIYRDLGADIIGMTAFPEYALAREAGMCYLPCSFVTDYDCWDDQIAHVTLQEIIELMRKNNVKAFNLVKKIMEGPEPGECSCKQDSLQTGILTSPELIPEEAREWLEVVTG